MTDYCDKVEQNGLLIRLLDKELSADEQEAVMAHIRTCERCLARMAELMMSDAQLRQTVKVGTALTSEEETVGITMVDTPSDRDDMPDADEILPGATPEGLKVGCTVQVSNLPVGEKLTFDLYDTRGQLLISRDTPLSINLIERLMRRNITVVSIGPPDKPLHSALTREAELFNGRPNREFYASLGNTSIAANISTIAKQVALDSLKKAFYSLGPESAMDLDDVQDTCEEMIEDLVGDEVTTLSIIDMYLLDSSLYHHSINVTAIFATICRALNLPADRIKIYAAAAMLHDLGRVLLRKLARRRIPSTVDVDRLHPEAGYRYLKGLGGMDEGPLNAVRNHHERYDGRGHPRGIDVKGLGDYGQALILANYYDNNTWDISRKMKTSYHLAANSIIQLSHKLVDNHIVTAFLNVFGHHPPGSWVQLNSGEVGMVVQGTPFKPRRPKVHIFYDSKGESLTEVIPIDLSIPDMPEILGPFIPINGVSEATNTPGSTSPE